LRDRVNLHGGQFSVRRHLEPVLIAHRTQQQAFFRLRNHDRRPRVPALQCGIARIKPQPAFGFFAGMALLATLNQQRPDSLLEMLGGLIRPDDTATSARFRDGPVAKALTSGES